MNNSAKFYVLKEIAPNLQRKFDIVLHILDLKDSLESLNTGAFSDRDFICVITAGDGVIVRRHGYKKTSTIRDPGGYSLSERSLTDDYEEAMEEAIRELLD